MDPQQPLPQIPRLLDRDPRPSRELTEIELEDLSNGRAIPECTNELW